MCHVVVRVHDYDVITMQTHGVSEAQGRSHLVPSDETNLGEDRTDEVMCLYPLSQRKSVGGLSHRVW